MYELGDKKKNYKYHVPYEIRVETLAEFESPVTEVIRGLNAKKDDLMFAQIYRILTPEYGEIETVYLNRKTIIEAFKQWIDDHKEGVTAYRFPVKIGDIVKAVMEDEDEPDIIHIIRYEVCGVAQIGDKQYVFDKDGERYEIGSKLCLIIPSEERKK